MKDGRRQQTKPFSMSVTIMENTTQIWETLMGLYRNKPILTWHSCIAGGFGTLCRLEETSSFVCYNFLTPHIKGLSTLGGRSNLSCVKWRNDLESDQEQRTQQYFTCLGNGCNHATSATVWPGYTCQWSPSSPLVMHSWDNPGNWVYWPPVTNTRGETPTRDEGGLSQSQVSG